MGYTKAEADAEIIFGYGEYEFLRVYRPTANEAPGAPWIVGMHGGLFSNPGDASLTMAATGFELVADALRAQGYYVFIVEHTPAGFNFDWHIQPFTCALWPEPLLSFLRSLAFIMSNATWDSNYGSKILTDSTSSIDPSLCAVYGSSSGADLCMLAGLVPPGRFPISGIVGMDTDQFSYNFFPRPKVVVNQIGQLDWTQYVFPLEPLSLVYADDLHQAIAFDGGHGPWATWTDTPMPIKKAMSPVWWLRAGYPGNRNVAFYHRYTTSELAEGSNLGAADWNPGTPVDDFVNGKAFADPHASYQAYGAEIEWAKAKGIRRVLRNSRIVTYDPASGLATLGATVPSVTDDIVSFVRTYIGV